MLEGSFSSLLFSCKDAAATNALAVVLPQAKLQNLKSARTRVALGRKDAGATNALAVVLLQAKLQNLKSARTRILSYPPHI